jgi:spore photoproduct lyase
MDIPGRDGKAHPPVVIVTPEGSGLAGLFQRVLQREGEPGAPAENIALVKGTASPMPAEDRQGLLVLTVGAAGRAHGPEPFVATSVIGAGRSGEIVPDAPPAEACAAMGVLAGALICSGPDSGRVGPGPSGSTAFFSTMDEIRFLEAGLSAAAHASGPHAVLIAGIAGEGMDVFPDDPAALQAGRLLVRFMVSWAGSLRKAAPAALPASPIPGLWLTASMEREARRLLHALAERTGMGGRGWMALQPVRRVLDSTLPAKQKGREFLQALRDLCLSAPSDPPRPSGGRSGLQGIRRVYVEEQALGLPATRALLASLEDRERIVIGSYKSLLNRRRQAPALQKRLLRAAVLGVKKGRFLQRQVQCSAPGGYDAFYASPVIGCLHECRYCFVESKWGCGHLVVFVNHEDFVRSVVERLQDSAGPRPWIAFGYDSELLEFSSFYPAAPALLDALAAIDGKPRSRGLVEIITKSASTRLLDGRAPLGSLVVSFSLSPHDVWERFEEGTAPPEKRLAAAAGLLASGWKVGLRIDPVLPVRRCFEIYSRFLRELGSHLPLDRLALLEMGGLRFPGSSGDRPYYRIAGIGRAEYAACLNDLRKILPPGAVT